MKNPKYLRWVRTQPCVICGQEAEAHHLIGHGQGGMAMKSSDYFAFPLCHADHMNLHDHGYKTWENVYGSQWRYAAQTMERYLSTTC